MFSETKLTLAAVALAAFANAAMALADAYTLSSKANGAVVDWTDGSYYAGCSAPSDPGSATVGVPAGGADSRPRFKEDACGAAAAAKKDTPGV